MSEHSKIGKAPIFLQILAQEAASDGEVGFLRFGHLLTHRRSTESDLFLLFFPSVFVLFFRCWPTIYRVVGAKRKRENNKFENKIWKNVLEHVFFELEKKKMKHVGIGKRDS